MISGWASPITADLTRREAEMANESFDICRDRNFPSTLDFGDLSYSDARFSPKSLDHCAAGDPARRINEIKGGIGLRMR